MSYSEIVVILDRSGSMWSGKTDHEGGLNSFVEDQKKLPGKVKFSLIQFDSVNPFDVVYDRVDIQDVQKFELVPRGGTPLTESVTRSVVHIGDKMKSDEKPDQVVVMIITDGMEEVAPKDRKPEYSKDRLKKLIEEKQKAEWEFLYLGANVDAFIEADGLGITAKSALNFNNFAPQAVNNAYSLLNSKMGTSRRMYQAGLSKADVDEAGCYSFNAEERTQTV
jgi:uncharacterized protein YegL